MGNKIQADDRFEIEDGSNMIVILEKEKSSRLSDQAEGMYVVPNNTNCVKISEFVTSLIGEHVALFLSGQEFTSNYTPLHMLRSLMEDECLHFIYAEQSNYGEVELIEDYVHAIDAKVEDIARIVLKSWEGAGEKLKIRAWNECSVRQLALIIERIIKRQGVKIYNGEALVEEEMIVNDLKRLTQIDGLIHLKYRYG